VPGLEQHRFVAGSDQSSVEPLRQRPGLQANPRNLQILASQEVDQGFRLARYLRFTHHLASRVDHAHTRLFQRHI